MGFVYLENQIILRLTVKATMRTDWGNSATGSWEKCKLKWLKGWVLPTRLPVTNWETMCSSFDSVSLLLGVISEEMSRALFRGLAWRLLSEHCLKQILEATQMAPSPQYLIIHLCNGIFCNHDSNVEENIHLRQNVWKIGYNRIYKANVSVKNLCKHRGKKNLGRH